VNARAWPQWLLPFVLSACVAEPPADQRGPGVDAAWLYPPVPEASFDDDAGARWNAPTPTYAPTFSAIYFEILDLNYCTSVFCHGGGGITLDFATVSAAHAALVNQVPTGIHCADSGLKLVVPGDPDASLLLGKVGSGPPPCGDHMPPVAGYSLRPREIEQIREWIARGALND